MDLCDFSVTKIAQKMPSPSSIFSHCQIWGQEACVTSGTAKLCYTPDAPINVVDDVNFVCHDQNETGCRYWAGG